MSGFWRRNRRSLLVLPVVATLAAAATSQRTVDYWWPSDTHDRVALDASGKATLEAVVRDANGAHPARLQVGHVEAVPVTAYQESPSAEPDEEVTVPAGVRLWRVTLHFTVEPDTVVGACTVDLRDHRGRTYTQGTRGLGGFSSAGSPCVPPETPGPGIAFRKGATAAPSGEPPRPESYDTYVHFVMPPAAVPDVVRVWLELPSYAQFDVEKH